MNSTLNNLSIKEVQKVTYNGSYITIGPMSTNVFSTSIKVKTYTDQGYSFLGYTPESTGDYIIMGYRLDGTNKTIRISALNTYTQSQDIIIGGYALFYK